MMAMTFRSLLYLLLTLLAMMNLAQAESLYSNCISASDFGGVRQVTLSVTPIGYKCYSLCKNACNVFSTKAPMELNQDIINACNKQCIAGGAPFTSTKKVLSANTPNSFEVSSEVYSAGTSCSQDPKAEDSPDYLPIDAQLNVQANDTFFVNLFPSPFGDDNKIVMCGKSSNTFSPSYESMKYSDWTANAAKWNKFDNTPSTYSIRNPYYTYTGIDVIDGDEISMTFDGQARTYCSSSTAVCAKKNAIDDVIILKSPTIAYGSNNLDPTIYLGTGALQYPTIDGTTGAITSTGAQMESIIQNNLSLIKYGLTPTGDLKKTRFGSGLTFPDLNTPVSNGSAMVDPMDKVMTVGGKLTGFTTQYTPLGFKIYGKDFMTSSTASTTWNQYSLGGYKFSITREGCVFRDGTQLQYGIGTADTTTDPKNPIYLLPTTWIDITPAQLSQSTTLTAAQAGKLYFRIKPVDYNPSFAPTCAPTDTICNTLKSNVSTLYTTQNRSGQYYISIKGKNTLSNDYLSTVVGYIRSYFFGDPTVSGSTGLVQQIFNSLVGNSSLVQAVRALLVLYIAWTGLSFMMGIAQFTQKEGSIRLIKVGLVVTLISPNSWEFFNITVFKFFTEGALELLVYLTADPMKSYADMQVLLTNPVKIFDTFFEPFNIFFARVTWIKASALLFSNPYGIILFLTILVAAFFYALCLMKAIMAYLVSVMAMAVLLMMAPIFICFVLFQFTKQMFDTWWKLLLSFAFQPILIFTTLIVMNYLVLMALKMALGFSVCEICYFRLIIPNIYDSGCIFSWYLPVYKLHTAGGPTASPVAVLLQSFYLLILSQVTYAFTETAGRLGNLIIMGSPMGVDTMAEGNKMRGSIISTTTSGFLRTFGLDSGSIGRAEKSVETGAKLHHKHFVRGRKGSGDGKGGGDGNTGGDGS